MSRRLHICLQLKNDCSVESSRAYSVFRAAKRICELSLAGVSPADENMRGRRRLALKFIEKHEHFPARSFKKFCHSAIAANDLALSLGYDTQKLTFRQLFARVRIDRVKGCKYDSLYLFMARVDVSRV